MKKFGLLLVLVMLIAALPAISFAENTTYREAPMLEERVEAGLLPPVEERLPDEPVTIQMYSEEQLEFEIGTYGGTLNSCFMTVNWNPDLFVGMCECLLTAPDQNTGEMLPNLVGSFELSEDLTTYTFTLRKGLRWSDGTEVTMEDFRFAIEDVDLNSELIPSIATWKIVDGQPYTFKVIDDQTFEIRFAAPYGSFSSYLSKWFYGYSEFLKPAYYLKPFHRDYADECHGSLEAYYEYIAPFGAVMGYDDVTDDGVWTYIFNQVDCTAWEITDPADCLTSKFFAGLIDKDFPMLTPWIMISDESNVQTWERNPYYHIVDAEGNQLPYIDYLQNELVESVEMVQLKVMGGEVDFLRESATVDNISLYRENAGSANINPIILMQGNTPTDLFLNINYGLDTNGQVKDDEASRAWQEVIQDPDFRRAIAMSIDAQEILTYIYNDLGEVREGTYCVNDIDGANQILDEMGMLDIDGDGYRETPSGLPFQFIIWNGAEASDIIPVSELYAEYIRETGINVSINSTDTTLLATSQAANQVPARCYWSSHSISWAGNGNCNMSIWAPLWANWYDAGLPEEGDFLKPTDPADITMMNEMFNMMTYSSDYITETARPAVLNRMDSQCYVIRPLEWVGGVVVLNGDLKNYAQNVTTHNVNEFLEGMYFAE